ncbi:MAG: cobalamin-binding protein [Alphaproteobacteria bacterium]|jgi:iron complex transport system substrate-binding protein|nr:cobalamin-binding protein [Alphaproteobacteria bacterium]
MKIVSLLPSATEIVAALGLAENLVGRSHECDWPAGLDHLPVLTQPKMNPLENAATIDRDVRALVEDGTSVYKLDADAIRAIAPDFVITQSQCELCAVSLGEVETALQDWVGATRPKLVSLEPMSLADLADDIAKTGAALDVEQRADRLNVDMAEGFAALRATTETLPRKKVFFMEWTTPLMGAGNWMPETIAAAGGEVVLGQEGVHSPTVTLAEIAAADPDVILVGPCGFSIDRARQEMAVLQDNKDWQELRAVRAGDVYLVNGNHFFNRPGPRLLQSAEIVAEILHPHIYAAANHGTGWVRHA